MFCKKCGKEIAADSLFCKYCGAKQNVDRCEEVFQGESEVRAKVEIFDGHKPEKEAKKQKTKSSIANEIIAIGWLLLIALLLWGVYVVGFVMYRSNDRKPAPALPFGGSCYDPEVIMGHYILNDKDAEKLWHDLVYDEKQRGRQYSEYMTTSDGTKIKLHSSWSEMTEEEKNKWKEEEINKGRAEWNDNLNSIRENGYDNELKDHLWWSILIILCSLFIIRYVYKAIKWVKHNKTK